jgi:hypothetical protein
LWVLAGESRERSDSLEDGILQDNDGNKRQTVEIQVGHVGPDLQFATAEVTKSKGRGRSVCGLLEAPG